MCACAHACACVCSYLLHDGLPEDVLTGLIEDNVARVKPVLDGLKGFDRDGLNAHGQLLEVLPHEHKIEVLQSELDALHACNFHLVEVDHHGRVVVECDERVHGRHDLHLLLGRHTRESQLLVGDVELDLVGRLSGVLAQLVLHLLDELQEALVPDPQRTAYSTQRGRGSERINSEPTRRSECFLASLAGLAPSPRANACALQALVADHFFLRRRSSFSSCRPSSSRQREDIERSSLLSTTSTKNCKC